MTIDGSAVGSASAAGTESRALVWVRRAAREVWLPPTVLTLAAGAFQVARPELWRDELRSWSAASRELPDLVQLLGQTDAAVSLYYLILHAWIAVFGDSVAALRALSVIAMGAAAAMVALVGRRLYNDHVGLIAGLLFAVIPNVTRYAQEARPYALALFLAGLSTLLFLRAVQRASAARLAGYGLSVAALVLMQVVMALPLLAVHGVGALLWARRDRRALVALGCAAAGGIAVASPVIIISRAQYAHQVGALPDATLAELTRLPARLFASGLVAGVIVALAAAGLARDRWRPYAFAAGLALAPPAALWLVSQGGDSYWMTRYALGSLLGFAILAAVGAVAVATAARVPPILATIAVAVVALVGVADHRAVRARQSHDVWNYPEANPQFFNYSGLASVLAENMRPGDGIVYAERGHFWLAEAGVAYHLRHQEQPVDVFVATSAVERGDFWAIECAPIVSCAPAQERLWLVSTDWVWESDPLRWMDDEKAELLRETYRVAQRFTTVPIGDRWTPTDFGLVLTLLVRDDASGPR